jgi:cell division protein FtsB
LTRPIARLTKFFLTGRIISDSFSFMRIRRSVARVFGWMILPAMTVAVVAYFGYYAVYGTRGYVALHTVTTELSQSNVKLAQLTERRMRLEHRITLLKAGDPDLVEELARTKLMDGAPGQVAIPRDRQ